MIISRRTVPRAFGWRFANLVAGRSWQSETLEPRRLFSSLQVAGGAGDDTLIVMATGAAAGSYTLNGSAPVSFSGLDSCSFQGNGGNDTLRILNPSGGLFAPAGGIAYDGGGQSGPPGDLLEDLGGIADGGSYSAADGGSGTITHQGGGASQVIHFTGLEPISDLVPSNFFVFDAPAPTFGSGIIRLENGAAAGGQNTSLLSASDGGFESIQFQNKLNVTINAGAYDSISLNNPNPAAGFGTLTVNGGNGDDVFDLRAPLPGLTVQISGDAGNDRIRGNVTGATWKILDANFGSIDGFVDEFISIENLTGALEDDQFVFTNDHSSLDGTIDGAGGVNTLSYAGVTTPVSVNLGLGVTGLTANLTGDQAKTDNAGTGTATLSFNGTLSVNLNVSGISRTEVTGLTIQTGIVTIGGTGSIDLLSLAPLLQTADGFSYTVTNVPLGAFSQAGLLGGVSFLSVATGPNSGIRGQVSPTGSVAVNATASKVGGVSNIQNVTGGTGDDSLIGSFDSNQVFGGQGNDIIIGGPGNDTLSGDEQFDTIAWVDGDGSDTIDGGPGDNRGNEDRIQIAGSIGPVGDQFSIAANGSRLSVSRTNLDPMTLNIGTSEDVFIDGAAGDDQFQVQNLAGVTGMNTVTLAGLEGNDTFNVTPNPDVFISLYGYGPAVPGAAGDTLNVDLADAADPSFIAQNQLRGISGQWSFSNRKGIFFDGLEAFTPAAPISISGNVFNDLNRNLVRDAGERPLSGALVGLLTDPPAIDGDAVALATTNANGDYTFFLSDPGAYNVEQFQTPAGYYQLSPKPAELHLSAGSSITHLDLADAATVLYAVTDNNVLISFDAATPSGFHSMEAVEGLQPGEEIEGIDFRPADALLYGLGVTGTTGRVYRIDAASAAATQIGNTFAFSAGASAYGLDFDPVQDLLRILDDQKDNYVFDVKTGTMTPQTALSVANIAALAYTNNRPGGAAGSSVALVLDHSTDSLKTLNPETGELTLVDSLEDAPDFQAVNGFDADGFSDTIFAALYSGTGSSQLFTISATGAQATLIGSIGSSGTIVRGISAVNPGPAPVAVDDAVTRNVGQPVDINVLANDSDPLNRAFDPSIVTPPVGGTATKGEDGIITYTPNPGFNSVDSFVYRLNIGTNAFADATVTVTPTGVGLDQDPQNPALTALYVLGTPNADFVQIKKKKTQIQVFINRVAVGSPLNIPTGSVIIEGGGGDDNLSVGPLKASAARLFGGEGNDILKGTKFADVLVGGGGADTITGAAGNDVIIGGDGPDILKGVGGDDLIVAGATTFDTFTSANLASLLNILGTWNNGAAYAGRVTSVTGSPLLTADKLADDSDADQLLGAAGADLFFANTTGGSATDVLKGSKPNETVIDEP